MASRPGVEHPAQRVVRQPVDAAQRHVRQRADGQRHLLLAQPGHQRRVLQAADAVVDPLDAEPVERRPDVGGRPLLPRVRHPVQPLVGGQGEGPLEQLRRVADLGAVQADPDDEVAVAAAAAARRSSASAGSRSRRKQAISRALTPVPLRGAARTPPPGRP